MMMASLSSRSSAVPTPRIDAAKLQVFPLPRYAKLPLKAEVLQEVRLTFLAQLGSNVFCQTTDFAMGRRKLVLRHNTLEHRPTALRSARTFTPAASHVRTRVHPLASTSTSDKGCG